MKFFFVLYLIPFVFCACDYQKKVTINKNEMEVSNSYPSGLFYAIQILENKNTSNFIVIEDDAFFDFLKKSRGFTLNQFHQEFARIKANDMQFKIKDSSEYGLLVPYLINPRLCINDSVATNIMNSLKQQKQVVQNIITDTKCTLFILCRNKLKVWQDDESGSFVIRSH